MGIIRGNGIPEQGFLYSHGNYTILNFPGAINTVAYSINASGQVVGFYEDGSNGSITSQHGFLYSGGTYSTIDPPGALDPLPTASTTRADRRVLLR